MLQPESPNRETVEPWTIPDSICAFRIVGSVGLIGLAIIDAPIWFVGFYIVLGISDLVDGPIARAIKQQTKYGAKLDSLADVMLSTSLLIGAAILSWETLLGEIVFVVAAVVSYAIAIGFGYWKFKKIPSYHTWTAKLTHLLTAIAGICLILDWSVVPLRIAAVSAVIANLESLIISFKSNVCLTDVPSVFRMSASNQKEVGE